MFRLVRINPLNNRGRAATIALVAAGFAAGAALVAVVFRFHTDVKSALRSVESAPPAQQASAKTLSESSLIFLKALASPVDIRSYAVLDPATVPESVRAFARRSDELLAAFEKASAGKVRVDRRYSQTDLNSEAPAAAADHLQPFNFERGGACYLGLSISANNQTQVLARLDPRWEAALESDICRAIDRVANAKAATVNSSSDVAQPDPAVLAEVKRIIPDPESTALAEGVKLIRESGRKDFEAAAKEMQVQVEAAQQQVANAENGPPADLEIARKHLQEVQAAQNQKLLDIANRSAVQIQVFQQLKNSEQ